MAKIMLVEDDNNLREIYEARLLAEGYEIVSAKDGEEALALAVKEKPDLIISDVMMPKISGFDMLDILRTTPETKNTKVVMMTALSQAEDKSRADKLGADRYLVKSQVTLEDVAAVAKEVLSGKEATPAVTNPQSEPANQPVATNPSPSATTAVPAQTTSTPTPALNPVAAPQPTQPEPVAAPPADDSATVTPAPAHSIPQNPVAPAPDVTATPAAPGPVATPPAPDNTATVTDQPVAPAPIPTPVADTTDQIADTTAHEKQVINDQIQEFASQSEPVAQTPATPEPVATPPAPDNTATVTDQPVAPAPEPPTADTADNTNKAAETAEKLTETVNEALDESQTTASTTNPVAAGNKKKVIEPLSDPEKKPDIVKMAEAEEAKEKAAKTAPQVIQPNQNAPTNSAPDGVSGDDPNSIAL